MDIFPDFLSALCRMASFRGPKRPSSFSVPAASTVQVIVQQTLRDNDGFAMIHLLGNRCLGIMKNIVPAPACANWNSAQMRRGDYWPGSKASARYGLEIVAGESASVKLRLISVRI